MAHNLSADKIMELKQTFQKFKPDENDRIKTDHLGVLFMAVNRDLNQDQLREIIVGLKDPGHIEFLEFLCIMAPATQPDILDSFRVFDTNGDGHISAAVLREVFRQNKLSEDEIKVIMDMVEVDNHGQIDYNKLVDNMKD